jgi:trans-aconitate methyltransferase
MEEKQKKMAATLQQVQDDLASSQDHAAKVAQRVAKVEEVVRDPEEETQGPEEAAEPPPGPRAEPEEQDAEEEEAPPEKDVQTTSKTQGKLAEELTKCYTLAEESTPPDYKEVLQKEVTSYEGSEKFKNKVAECDGRVEMKWTSGRVGEIYNILTKMVKGKKSILDLGCACGGITKKMKTFAPAGVRMVGVDLVPGWIKVAKAHIADIDFSVGDVTEINLGETFELIYMADSYEHIPSYRKRHLWEVLKRHSKVGTMLYIHIPTPGKQRHENEEKEQAEHGQYIEEVIQYKVTVRMAACWGSFRKLSLQEHDIDGYASLIFQRE